MGYEILNRQAPRGDRIRDQRLIILDTTLTQREYHAPR